MMTTIGTRFNGRSGRGALSRRAPLAALLGAALMSGAGGCYAPDYENGGFACPSEQCPEGFYCNSEGRAVNNQELRICRPLPARSVTDPELSFRFVNPLTKAALDAPTFKGPDGLKATIAVTVHNFILDPAAMGKAEQAGHGHYHLFLDRADDDAYIGAAADTLHEVNLAKLSRGQHWLILMLRQNDHVPLIPLTQFAVQFVVL